MSLGFQFLNMVFESSHWTKDKSFDVGISVEVLIKIVNHIPRLGFCGKKSEIAKAK